jgi:gas vesicle protein
MLGEADKIKLNKKFKIEHGYEVMSVDLDNINYPKKEKGKRSKLTRETMEDIVKCLEHGMALSHACSYARISSETMRIWQEKFPEVKEAVDKAQSHAVMRCLETINHEAVDMKNWNAAAWLLERRFPHAFNKTVTEVVGGDKPIKIKLEWSD